MFMWLIKVCKIYVSFLVNVESRLIHSLNYRHWIWNVLNMNYGDWSNPTGHIFLDLNSFIWMTINYDIFGLFTTVGCGFPIVVWDDSSLDCLSRIRAKWPSERRTPLHSFQSEKHLTIGGVPFKFMCDRLY